MKTINDRFFWNAEHQCLIVDWTEELGVSCQQIIAGWKGGLDVRDYLFGKEDSLSLSDTRLDLLTDKPHPAVASWQGTFPAGVLADLRLLGRRQMQVLELCIDDEAALDLLCVNANLLLLWLDYCDSNELPQCQLHRGLRSGPEGIMAMMGLDNSRLALKMVRELAPDALNSRSRGAFRHLFSKSHILRRLMPAGKLNANLLEALDHWPWIAGHPIQALLSGNSSALRQSIVKVLNADRAELGMEAIDQLRNCRTVAQVQRVEACWHARINLQKVMDSLDASPISKAPSNKNRLPILQLPPVSFTSSRGVCLKTRQAMFKSNQH